MTSLRELCLDDHYRSDRNNLLTDFYVPALSAAIRYDRAVGYFTSSVLALFGRGITNFAGRGGHMRLIASPYLTEDDIDDIARGYDYRHVIENAIIRAVEEVDDPFEAAGLGRLGRLIAAEQLDVKIAFVQRGGRLGLYHEKLGVFRDADGDVIAFTGSSNETGQALLGNFESIEVYKSWVAADEHRAARVVRDFEDLWANRTTHLAVIDFPEIARDRLIRWAQDAPEPAGELESDDLGGIAVGPQRPTHGLVMPSSLDIRDYQRHAIEQWFRHDGRGILKMATGTGKTITALAAAAQLTRILERRDHPLATAIVVPYQHLVDQWAEEVRRFGVQPLTAYESTSTWIGPATDLAGALAIGVAPAAVAITTTATFQRPGFQRFLQRITTPLLLVADEVHNLGATRIRDRLPANADYRLALSATPERWFDDRGTDALIDYFGPVVFELALAAAIQMGALCHYRYYPVVVPLDHGEAELYTMLSEEIARLASAGDDELDADQGDSLLEQKLRKRAQVLGHAQGKLPALRQEVLRRRDQWFQLVYCAEGRRPALDGWMAEPSQIDEAMALIGRDLGLAAHKYVSTTDRAKRRRLLARFTTGDDLQLLLSMRCLDEGVDIPDARVAYLLASSSNPRQFIQRRGRILRRAANKTHADIVDFVAVPPNDPSDIYHEVERRLLERELRRVVEFAQLADNDGYALEVLRPLRRRYGLMDL